MCTEKDTTQITPDTKVGVLVANYPDLETVLAELSPSFGALQTPQLRQAAARNMTLAQLARADKLSLGTVIARLRDAAGFDATDVADATGGRPDWADAGAADRTLDARQIIESGGHPLDRVLQGVAELAPGEVYELITPFVPTPLIDLIQKQGCEAHCVTVGPGEFRTYFRHRSHP
jgi:uncharacterized protein (DUF2249 family)